MSVEVEKWLKVFLDEMEFTIRPDQDGLGLVEVIQTFHGKEEARLTIDAEAAMKVADAITEVSTGMRNK